MDVSTWLSKISQTEWNKRETEEQSFSPGRDKVAHASLFLLFLSFLNFGTRRNFATRLRFEKSVRGPCLQTDRWADSTYCTAVLHAVLLVHLMIWWFNDGTQPGNISQPTELQSNRTESCVQLFLLRRIQLLHTQTQCKCCHHNCTTLASVLYNCDDNTLNRRKRITMDIFPESSSSVSFNKTFTLITIWRTTLQLRDWGTEETWRGREERIERGEKARVKETNTGEKKSWVVDQISTVITSSQSVMFQPCLPQNFWSLHRPHPWPWSWHWQHGPVPVLDCGVIEQLHECWNTTRATIILNTLTTSVWTFVHYTSVWILTRTTF